MSWLTIFENGAYHVVPLNEDGEVIQGHMPQMHCPCQPEVEYTYDEDDEAISAITVIHNQIQ